MVCERCNLLLAEYKRKVDAFVNEVLKLREAFGPDAKLTAKEADRLRLKSHAARDALLEHWRQEHSTLAGAAKRLR
jgi:hypothetical protein